MRGRARRSQLTGNARGGVRSEGFQVSTQGEAGFPTPRLQPFVNVNLTLRVKSNLNHTTSVLHGSFLDAVRWAEPRGLAGPSAPPSLGWWPCPSCEIQSGARRSHAVRGVSEVNNEFHFQV